jgi:5-methylcytosine-specific restriction endonuclease McrA
MNNELKLLTEQCNTEIEEIKTKYKLLKQQVRDRYKNQKKNDGKSKKQHIPKKLKNMIWDKYVGKEKGIGQCYCCSEYIDSKNFEAGHIIPEAKGGPTNLDNLRPICSCCNKSMGTQNMDEFKEKYMKQHNIPMSMSFEFQNKNPLNTFNTSNTLNRFDRGVYTDDRILINEILGMPNQRQNRFQMEY